MRTTLKTLLATGAIAATALSATGGTAQAAGERWPTVRAGAAGVDVRTVQSLVRNAYEGRDGDGIVRVDGAYGPMTREAVRGIQRERGLQADGIVGAATWNVLAVAVSPGARGDEVLALQWQLRALGYAVKPDGVYGPATTAAVTRAQGRFHLRVTGRTDAATWKALVATSR